MGTVVHVEGAIADPATRHALWRELAMSALVFLGSLALLWVAFSSFFDADRRQEDLVRDGEVVSGIILTVDQPVPGVDEATFAYPAGDGRLTRTFVVFNSYERGQKVQVYVSRTDPSQATLAGETPQSGLGWTVTLVAFLVGLVGVPLGGRRLVRAARAWSVLREHPWATWTMQAVYPKRRRLAVTLEGHPEEHLIRLDARAARKLGKLPRKGPLYLAGSGRWFVVSPVEGRRLVALGRMDEPIERLHFVGAGAAPDRFDVDEEDEDEAPVEGGVWAEKDPRKVGLEDPLKDQIF